jgi:hypothetical protein
MRLYGSCGFLVNMTHADGEFKVLRGRLYDAGSGLNVCLNAEHVVPKIERFIRTVKERSRCIYNSVPFQCFPILLIKEMVTACVFWLNMSPPNDGISLASLSITPSTAVLSLGPTCKLTRTTIIPCSPGPWVQLLSGLLGTGKAVTIS